MVTDKPMLACTRNVLTADLPELFNRFPALYVTPKLDGIRCRIVSEGGKLVGVSRKHLAIPNAQVQMWIEDSKHLKPGMDGELIVPGKSFNDTQSLIMTSNSIPFQFIYYIFDYESPRETYLQRLQTLRHVYKFNKQTRFLEPDKVTNVEDLLLVEQTALDQGFEGLILRTGDSPYKHGRATWKEGYMYKMKRFEDVEAIILGFVEKLKNNNPKERDAHGHAKRSKHKANLTPSNTLGALHVRDVLTGIEFELGAQPMGDELAKKVWDNQEDYLGEYVTYKHQPHGRLRKPRSPIWKGFRYD